MSDYDGPKAFTRKEVLARKAHQCCECHRKIWPGEPYMLHKGLWDDWQTFKMCLVCDYVFTQIDEPVYTMLREDLRSAGESLELMAERLGILKEATP